MAAVGAHSADLPGADRLTADSPTGIRHVLVNGTVITQDGASVASALDERPGQRPIQLGHA